MRFRPHIHLVSLGCAKNTVDSERALARLAAAGAIVNAPIEEADIILVNTCGFIEPAKEESLEMILHSARHKQTGRCRKLIVMGCLAQRYGKVLRRSLPEVDAVFGLGKDADIISACGFETSPTKDAGRFLLTPKHTAYLRISDGCDNRCAYCAIPLIRGAFRSRPLDEVLSEAEQLVAQGARELNIIGQDTTLYGADLLGKTRIHDLLARLARIRNVKWLRLLYTHPAHFSSELVDTYARLPKLVPYVDLPLQHLNDEVLRRMGRKVTQAQIREIISRLREKVSNIAIRTAFIVGFPGETRKQFNELLRGIEELRFDHLGAFAYSREEGTPAAQMHGQISETAKVRRMRKVMLTQQKIVFETNRLMAGKTIKVLIDGPAEEPGTWIGRSSSQSPDVDSVTLVKGKGPTVGRFLKAKIYGSTKYDLLAKSC